jgi:phosphate/sulfate permease
MFVVAQPYQFVKLNKSAGIPISTTHTLAGAVLGVGRARGIGALNMRVVGRIFLSWIITSRWAQLSQSCSFSCLGQFSVSSPATFGA